MDMEECIDIKVAQAIINDMAKPLQDLVTKALQKQAREFADHMGDVVVRDGLQNKAMEAAHKAEVEKLQVAMQSMRDASATATEALKRQHEAERREMLTKYQQYKQDLHEEMDNLIMDRAKLMAMVAPLEVWARIVLPKASAPSSAPSSASSCQAATKTKSVWIADGQYSIRFRANDAGIKKSHDDYDSASSFQYDRVFGPTSMNGQVFDALSVWVNHGLDSKHLMLLMYGRSGTGKSQTLIRPYTQQVLDPCEEKHGRLVHHSPLIKRILETAFGRARARARSDDDDDDKVQAADGTTTTILARITCLEYRANHFYDLSRKAPKHMTLDPQSGRFRIVGVAGRHPPATKACTSAREAVAYIQQSDQHRGTGETTENQKSSRGHAWYEVRMCRRRTSREQDDDDDDDDNDDDIVELGVFSFFDLGGLEKLQTAKKSESTSLTQALAALKTPFQAIAARDREWEAPDGNPFVQAITPQLKGTGPYEKFGRPQMIVLGQVNGYEHTRDESREVLETLQSWRTLR
ncbi:hypothetical protein ACEQ8H_008390 [Pleosporales sp. CAS-2024a]